MDDSMYLAIGVVTGIVFVYVANKTFLPELFESMFEEGFGDFLMKGFFQFIVFFMGMAWPITITGALILGGLYYIWLLKNQTKHTAD